MSRVWRQCCPVLLSLLLAACAGEEHSFPASPSDAVEVFYSRSSLAVKEFEHFKVQAGILFCECGFILGGRYHVKEREVFPLEASGLASLLSLTTAVRNAAEGFSSSDAGDDSNFAAPGKYVFTLSDSGSTEVRLPFDSVTAREDVLQNALFDLTIALRRRAGRALCGNRTFFGLPE